MQAYENQSLVNITAVATIFTAVTATTVQTSLSVMTVTFPLTDVVNACWGYIMLGTVFVRASDYRGH